MIGDKSYYRRERGKAWVANSSPLHGPWAHLLKPVYPPRRVPGVSQALESLGDVQVRRTSYMYATDNDDVTVTSRRVRERVGALHAFPAGDLHLGCYLPA